LTDTVSLVTQLAAIREFAPDAFDLVADQMVRIANQRPQDLSIGVLVTLALTLWSASRGIAALMAAMNMAYKESEKRSIIRFNLLAFGFTLAGIVFVILSLAAIAAVPPILEAIYLGAFLEALIRGVRWLLVIALFLVASAAIYRYAPSREGRARWRWIMPGAIAAAMLWSLASIAFSSYLTNFNAYNATFGSLGAVAALLMWFWISAYVICMGAQLNSQLELFTTKDTTIHAPAPAGMRGAYVADHAEDPEEHEAPGGRGVKTQQSMEREPG
jgi:membrane protein